MRPVPQGLPDSAAVLQGYIEAARLPEDMLELLAGFADRRRVDDRHHLFDVIHDDAIKERFIAVLQRDEIQVFLQVGRFLADIVKHAQFLLGDGVHARRQQASQIEKVSLCIGIGGALVADWIVENLYASIGRGRGLVVHERLLWSGAPILERYGRQRRV